MAITVTDRAANEIKRHLEAQEPEAGSMLRLAIAGGGCSGLRYTLGFDSAFDPDVDVQYPQHGITLVASKKMALYLDGTTVDFQEGPMGRGFSIDNPNVPRGGGCPGCGHH